MAVHDTEATELDLGIGPGTVDFRRANTVPNNRDAGLVGCTGDGSSEAHARDSCHNCVNC